MGYQFVLLWEGLNPRASFLKLLESDQFKVIYDSEGDTGNFTVYFEDQHASVQVSPNCKLLVSYPCERGCEYMNRLLDKIYPSLVYESESHPVLKTSQIVGTTSLPGTIYGVVSPCLREIALQSCLMGRKFVNFWIGTQIATIVATDRMLVHSIACDNSGNSPIVGVIGSKENEGEISTLTGMTIYPGRVQMETGTPLATLRSSDSLIGFVAGTIGSIEAVLVYTSK